MASIIIPTLNRSEFVIRQLRYYASVQCPHTIYIGDSSDLNHVEKTLSVVRELENKVKIVYKQYPELNDYQCLKELIRISDEEYIAYVGDDDFIIPNSLTKCEEFLKNNPGYRTAQGRGIVFSVPTNILYGKDLKIGVYSLRSAEADCPVQRLDDYLRNYWVALFSVHRKDEFLEDQSNIEVITDRSFSEIMPNCLSIIHGKSKQLECMYLVRQVHQQRYTLLGALGWITSPNWYANYQIFHDSLTKALVERTSLDLDKSRSIVKQAFGYSLARGILKNYPSLFKSNTSGKYVEIRRKIAKRFPIVKRLYLESKARLPMCNNDMNLFALRNPSSIYYDDFIPVYKSITDEHLLNRTN